MCFKYNWEFSQRWRFFFSLQFHGFGKWLQLHTTNLEVPIFSLKVKLGWLYLYFHRLFPFFYTDISYSLVQRKQKWECVFPNINKQAWIYIIHHIIHVAFLIYPLICFLRFLKTPYGHYFLPMWKLPFTFC